MKDEAASFGTTIGGSVRASKETIAMQMKDLLQRIAEFAKDRPG